MPIALLAQAQAEASVIATASGHCGWFGHRGPLGTAGRFSPVRPAGHPGPFGEHCFRNE